MRYLKNKFLRLKNYYQTLSARQRRLRLFSFLILLFFTLGVLIVPSVAFAETDFKTAIYNGFLELLSKAFLWLAEICIKLTIFALKFIIEIGGYNGYIDSTAVTVGWVMVRDVGNMFFVVILLLIAFGTILGIESYEWKKLLVKFFFAAILINFSRIICGLIIDAAQVVMITFINGVAATAGGNLINFFNFNDIMKLSAAAKPDQITQDGNVFMASVAAFVFSVMALTMIAVYLLILLLRMIALWILIVLSPLAFALSVIPHTQKYAQNWWQEFSQEILIGPILAFFLWLSFVTLSSNVHSDITGNSVTAQAGLGTQTVESEAGAVGQSTSGSAGITKAMSWDSMANFFIAIGMLYVGAQKAQETGAHGANMLSKVGDFGKRVATIASGVAVGHWLVGKGEHAVSAVGSGLAKVGKGALWYMPLVGGEKWARGAKRQFAGLKSWYYDTGYRPVKDKDGNITMEKRKGHHIQRAANWFARKDMQSEKELKKTEDFAKNRQELLSKRVTGVPTYWMMSKDEKIEALDRMEQGMLAEEKARSEAKTKEFQAVGKIMVGHSPRIKNGGLEDKNPTIEEQKAAHLVAAEAWEGLEHAHLEDAKRAFLAGDQSREWTKSTLSSAKAEPVDAAKMRQEGKTEDEIKLAQARSRQVAQGKMALHIMVHAEQEKKAAEDLVGQMKQQEIGDIFEGAQEELAQAMEQLKKGEKTYAELANEMKNVGAKAALAEIAHSYYKDRLAGISKDMAVDQAESMMSFERTGNETPNSAFKKASKKQMEALEGVERERGVAMAADSFKKLLVTKKRVEADGGKLDVDQEAQYMASLQFLTKNGWSDDLLARLTNVARSADGYGANDHSVAAEEARTLKSILVDDCEWNLEDNDSSNRRTNDMHRLMAFAGDSGLLQSENAVAAYHAMLGAKGQKVTRSEAAKQLAEKIKTTSGGAAAVATELQRDEHMAKVIKAEEWSGDRFTKQMQQFNDRFVEGLTDPHEMAKKFVDNIKKYGNQLEILTEMKPVAINTTHIDDAGHGYFDMQEGYAYGQLSNEAMEFMLGDWIKLNASKKMSSLKSHAVGDMDEDSGTLRNFDKRRLGATFEGVDTKTKLEQPDTRFKRHLVKYAADEEFVNNEETGALKIGHEGSAILTKDYVEKYLARFIKGGSKFSSREDAIEQATRDAQEEVARDFAVALEAAPQALMAYLGTGGGVSFEDSMEGKMNLDLFGVPIRSLEDFTTWINTRTAQRSDGKRDRREIGPLDHTKIKLPKAQKAAARAAGTPATTTTTSATATATTTTTTTATDAAPTPATTDGDVEDDEEVSPISSD